MQLKGYESNGKKMIVVNVSCLQKTSKIYRQLNIELSKILRNVHIPVKNVQNAILKIEHMGLDIILSNDQDLQFILRGQLLNDEPINVALSFSTQNHKAKQQIVFNEDGEKINKEFALNEPSDTRYVKKQRRNRQNGKDKAYYSSSSCSDNQKVDQEQEDNVICAFCKESVNNLEYIKKLGWFYGPFKYKKKEYYVHLMCAIWTPAVYLHKETNKMVNIKKEILRSNKIMCKSCGLLGGGLGCALKDCKQSFHFKCALSENIDTRLDHSKYELYCPTHAYILDEKIENEIENVHCEKCQIDENEDLILLCDNCDQAFHTYCLQYQLTAIPEGDWFCPHCADKNPTFFSINQLSKDLQLKKNLTLENNDFQKSLKSREIKPLNSQQIIGLNSQQRVNLNSQNNNSLNFQQMIGLNSQQMVGLNFEQNIEKNLEQTVQQNNAQIIGQSTEQNMIFYENSKSNSTQRTQSEQQNIWNTNQQIKSKKTELSDIFFH